LGGRVDWRILPNVVIGGGITYLQDEYQGALAFGRIDRTLSPLASLKGTSKNSDLCEFMRV
jgi:hypothetical protein